jgi:Tfp pilus assembly protein PilF
MNDLALARSTLENAVVADPQGILAQAASAKLFLNLREYEKARQMASIVLERQPSPAAYRLLAATYHGQGMMNEFVAAIQKADDLEKSNLHPDLRP